uniref:NADH dehydrogenase [ubiquinone] 1 alpha subcomplex subunit 12 n=1 Tax=Lepeophtheirus salmonis TaxID=72036 RepID=C1BTA2_LEPSM|nr:Probable NADH dehydrogenase 1 alpha subcomplex subunit 12 [Lepeophtheirus salmonis]
MSIITRFFGIDKVMSVVDLVKSNGGFKSSLKKLYLYDSLKSGELVGEDKYGNKYFQNNKYFHGSNRWVEYNTKCHLEYEGSMIPAEWFGWMHYKTDLPPTIAPPVKYDWMKDHEINLTGTNKAYTPYSTTKPKIESWVPSKKSSV